jgi:hypothetical protein
VFAEPGRRVPPRTNQPLRDRVVYCSPLTTAQLTNSNTGKINSIAVTKWRAGVVDAILVHKAYSIGLYFIERRSAGNRLERVSNIDVNDATTGL